VRWRAMTSRTPIGIDVGERLIQAVQLVRLASGWQMEAAASIRRSGSTAAADIHQLRGLLAARGFKGNSVVLAVPAKRLITGILELPPRTSKAPIEQLARAELARMHKCEATSLEMACWDLPAPIRATTSTFVMAAGCTYADADALLDLFEREGFEVQCLGTHTVALARACEPLLEEVSGASAILDVGWTSSRLVLVYGNVVVYERNLPRGGLRSLVRSLVPRLKLESDDVVDLLWAIGLGGDRRAPDTSKEVCDDIRTATTAHFQDVAKEMRIPFSYLANQYRNAEVKRLFLVGGGAAMPGLKDYLASTTELELWAVMPSDLARCPKSFEGEYGCSLTLAVGLARWKEG